MSTLAIIQARYSSTRFRGKALADLHGKPVIEHVYERAQKIWGVDKVVIAIPYGDLETPLLDWALGARVEYLATKVPVDDVLSRFIRVLEYEPNADAVIRLTGDCPMLEPDVCSQLLKAYQGTHVEYAWTDTHSGTWPDGLDCEVMSRRVLEEAHRTATAPEDREHVTSWIRRNVRPILSLPPSLTYHGWPKVSIDTPEDLERVREWMAHV